MRKSLAALFVCLAASVQAQPTDYGPAFHALDDEAVRVITWYPDAYAITERAADRRLRTRLFNRRTSEALAMAEYDAGRPGGEARLQAEVESETLRLQQAAAPRRHAAWANAQLRELWLDVRARRALGRRGTPVLVTEGGRWRIADALKGRPVRGGDEDDDAEAVATEFRDVMAVAQRDHHPPVARGKRAAYSTFTTRMYDQSGQEAGFVRWFAKERVLAWRFPNGREGVAMESKVPGGFKFTPTLSWANVQALAFLRQSARPPKPAIPVPAIHGGRIAAVGFDVPARGPCGAGAGQDIGCDGKEDGCTGLHFLDGTVFEECCTQHDRCYERDYQSGDCCEAWSWFAPNPAWHCARCNFSVVRCFATTAFDSWEGLSWEVGCTPRDSCERCDASEWCDVACSSCRQREDNSWRN